MDWSISLLAVPTEEPTAAPTEAPATDDGGGDDGAGDDGAGDDGAGDDGGNYGDNYGGEYGGNDDGGAADDQYATTGVGTYSSPYYANSATDDFVPLIPTVVDNGKIFAFGAVS
jgi:hypothetical protein